MYPPVTFAQKQALAAMLSALPRADQHALKQAVAAVPPGQRTIFMLSLFGLMDVGPRVGPMVEDEPLADDFVREIQAQTEAGIGTNGRPVSELARLATRGAELRAEKAAQAPRVRVTPPGAGMLGRMATVNEGGQLHEVINWTSDDNEDALAVTVTLAPLQDYSGNIQTTGFPAQVGSQVFTSTTATTSPVLQSGTPQNRPFANIAWTTRSAAKRAQVDIGKGVQISLVASTVRVDVGLDGGTSTGPMGLMGALGFFTCARTAPVTRTLFFDTALTAGTPGGTATGVIPAFARQLLPIQRSFASLTGGVPNAAAFTLDIRDIKGTTLYTLYGGDTQYSVMSAPLPLSDDAYDFVVTNQNSTYTIPTMRFIFELGL